MAKSEIVTKPLKESSLQQSFVKITENDDIDDISIDIEDSQVCKDISSVSTPSGISQMTDIDSKLIEEIKVCENPFPRSKFYIYNLSNNLASVFKFLLL